jgi:AcrR family transcriptional regulator
VELATDGAVREPRWQRLEHDQRRAQILDVAGRLFGQRGYAAVSSSEIAHEAGVTRGLLHHYFGSKRDLFLEAVRAVVHTPMVRLRASAADQAAEDVIAAAVDQWLTFVDRNRRTWFAAMAAEGFGRDEGLESIVDEARDGTVSVIVDVLGLTDRDSPVLRTVLRTYSGLAEQASREWLVRKRLTRAETHTLLSAALLAMVRDVVPAVEASAGGRRG